MGSKKNLLEAGADQIEGRRLISEFMFFPFIASLDYLKAVSYTHLTLPTNREV